MPYGPQRGRAHLIKSGWETLSVPRLGRAALQGGTATRLAKGGSSDSMAMFGVHAPGQMLVWLCVMGMSLETVHS